MKKRLLTLCSVLFFSLSATEVVFEQQGVTLTDEDIKLAASELSDFELADMRQNNDIFKQFITQLFIDKVMAAKVEKQLVKDKHFETVRQSVMDKFINKYYTKQKILEKVNAVKDYKTLAKQTYQANPTDYQKPQTQDYYHLLFVKQADEDNKAKAENVLKAIKSEEISIAEAAKKYHSSVAGTDENGILSKVSVKRLMKPIKEVVSVMSVGDISDVVETKAGYHIIALKKINPPELLPYDSELEKKIIAEIKEKMGRSVSADIRSEYQNDTSRTVNETLLKSITEKVLKTDK